MRQGGSDVSPAARVRRIVIVGGGTAGWMSAAGLSSLLRTSGLEIVLVESEQIGTVGVGEATLPHLKHFNDSLGINEAEFMAFTRATFKLGIQFCDWGRKGDAYIHPFGEYGRERAGVEFHHYWLRASRSGHTGRIDEHSLPIMMAERGRFGFPSADPASVMSSFSYAYQLDAGRYAAFLRTHAERDGVRRVEGRVVEVVRDAQSGDVSAIRLASGDEISADLFLDCSGFRSLLLGTELGVGYEDWSQWLPCDSAVAIPCRHGAELSPYTRATACEAGWKWRIPLQHRVGNGHVFCSQFTDVDRATADLLSTLEGEPLAQPNILRFKAGRRHRQWERNCIAVGLSGGFLEPLESTSIYLIQAAITALAEVLPDGPLDGSERDEFNRVLDLEYERIRDFLILHYHATQRDDSEFWNHVRTMQVPDSLAAKLELFRERGIVVEYKDGLFLHPSWIAVYLGQGILPRHHDPRVDGVDQGQLRRSLSEMAARIDRSVSTLQSHAQVLADYAPAATN
jgi:tryptophan halogenase